MGKNQHVTPRDGKWQVIGEGNTRATAITNTQNAAIKIEREISEKESHGHDPYPPKG